MLHSNHFESNEEHPHLEWHDPHPGAHHLGLFVRAEAILEGASTVRGFAGRAVETPHR